MKNLFISILAVSTLILSSCSNDLETIENAQTKQNINDNEQLSKKGNKLKPYHRTSFIQKSNEGLLYIKDNFIYNKNGFISKIGSKHYYGNYISPNPTPIHSESTEYKYTKGRITKETTYFYSKGKKIGTTSYIHKYNKNGFLIRTEIGNNNYKGYYSKNIRKINYQYKKGLLSKKTTIVYNFETRKLDTIVENYTFNKKTVTITSKKSKTVYTLDNKKNPLKEIYNHKYTLTDPIKFSKNNIKTIIISNKSNNYIIGKTYNNKYNKKGYLTKITVTPSEFDDHIRRLSYSYKK